MRARWPASIFTTQRLVLASCAAVLTAMAMVTAAPRAMAAAPPANDHLADATVINSVPFNDALDTTGATTDANDGPATSFCPLGSQASSNSVWYVYTNTSAAPQLLVADTTGTSYRTSEVIDVGSPSTPSPGECTEGTPGTVSAEVGAGVTAWIVVSSIDGAGGNLVISIDSLPPASNDTIGTATTISSLPFSDATGTFDATTDADDDQVRSACGGPSTNNSVWYVFTAGPGDTSVLYDTTGSTYSAGIIVATGSPGALTALTCAGSVVSVPTTPGTTYYALVYALNPGGGRLDLNVSRTPPPPTIHARFRAEGTVDHLGTAHLTGTYECSTDAVFAIMVAQATQGERAGNVSADESFSCDGHRKPFTATATAFEGEHRFTPGKLTIQFNLIACNKQQICTQPQPESQVIKLMPAHK